MFAAPALYGQDSALEAAQDVDAVVAQLIEKMRASQPPELTYSELAAKADLVVIAKMESKTELEWDDAIGGAFGKGSTILLRNKMPDGH
jgi:hypothetical protein